MIDTPTPTPTRRLPDGGDWIDRTRPLTFVFDGRTLTGFQGDTVASALLANGIDRVATSTYDRRPRGVMTAGMEEPNALVQVDWPGGASEPMLRATQVELVEGLRAASLAGKGRLSLAPGSNDPGRFDRRHVHADVLVIGAGAAGLAAARATAAETRLIVIDDGPAITAPDLTTRLETRLLARTTALGVYDHGYVTAVERRPNARTEGRLWHIRAGRIVLATGATERPIAFANGDRPGIMLASAAGAYLRRFAVRPGERAVIFANNDTTSAVADDLAAAGIALIETVDWRRNEVVVDTLADASGRLAGVVIAKIASDGAVDPATLRTVAADLLLVSGGWNPNVALWSQARGSLRFDERLAGFVPDRPFGPVEAVGACAGDVAGIGELLPLWVVPPAPVAGRPASDDDWAEHYLDLQRDATVRDLRRALGAGLTSIEHLKRYTTIGTAADQGKTSGVLASAIAAALLGQDVGAVGVPTYRPPYVPVSFAQLAGRDRGALIDPVRTTPIHPWHAANGAVFEDVGQWKRPRYFPGDGESMDAAVLRECRAAREGVAAMDASTLGKIDLQGPDAGPFLDRLYTNAFGRLAIGSCRYGLMCRADGMVFDDGVTSRLAEDRFHMTTTTGNAAAVLDWLEEWLQTEWPELHVRATSVTEQWATVAVVGPRSRDVLHTLAPDLALEPEAFPFMTWRDAVVAGIAGRIFRISFSGELAYEINVPSWSGLALWEAVMTAGAAYGIVPYGTEAMHVLRAEKGYPIVGQETDGTVAPQDLGMGWIVSKTKPFIGSRSHRRPDALRSDRRQLVAVLPSDPDELLPEGAQLVAADARLDAPPVPMLGHVTSSYRSAALGRTFALAMVRAGRERIGETVVAPLVDRTVTATIIEPVLYDPDNLRRDGDGR
ncbi:MAG: sarcosine oxidase, subunit alpha [Chloroflexota bacterium]|nr:sarcosine oxidase, subunit alpha [Chloroflexota bacterium]